MIYEFSPKQDLHGYDKPWAPGAGKNKYKDTFDGWTKPTDYWIYPVELPEGSWTLSATLRQGKPAISGCVVAFATSGTSYSDFQNIKICVNTLGEIVTTLSAPVTSEDSPVLAFYGTEEQFAQIMDTYEVQLELGSTTTAYEPYANICPPIGYDIWDPTNDEMIQVYSGYVNANTRELYLRPVYEEYAGEELVGPWMSSLDKYSEDATPTEGAFVIDFGGKLTSYEITPFMLQTLLDSLGIRQHFTDGAGLLNKLMDQAQGRVRSEEELLHLSRPLNVIAIGDQLPAGLTFKPISKDVLPGLPGKFIR